MPSSLAASLKTAILKTSYQNLKLYTMKDETKNKMAEILKAAQEKANQKTQPTNKPVEQKPQVKEETKPQEPEQELSNLTIDDLLSDSTNDVPLMDALCAPCKFEFPKAKEPEKKAIELVRYSDRAICVFGDTKPIKEQLKQLGGSFNRFLSYNGQKLAGWIFPKYRENEIRKALSL